MTTKTDDADLRRRVIAELDWEPAVDSAAIGVAAKDGVVTLTGAVASYAEKRNAERAAKRVKGVKGVAEELTIRLPEGFKRTDTEVAQMVLRVLGSNVSVPFDKVQVTVEDGWVTLDGTLEWQYQKAAAEKVIQYTVGVMGVTNRLTLKPHVNAADVKSKIESAFTRQAQLEANHVKVEADDSKVVLRGTVRTWREKSDAERAAWSAPGVIHVENDVVVSPW